jgi:hypothetical protein
MIVTFTRTGERTYRVSVDGTGIDTAYMDPAPGYDDRLPHDAAHFIVEDELGIRGGIFGQLAAGGTAGSFRSDGSEKPKKRKRRGAALSKANSADALFSEHAVYAAQSRWYRAEIVPDTKIPDADIARICARFEEFARKWSKLLIGGSIALSWNGDRQQSGKR